MSPPCRRLRRTLLFQALLTSIPAISPASAQEVLPRGYLADSSLVFLEPLIGTWAPIAAPDTIDPIDVAQRYEWVVGRKAIRVQEGLRQGPNGTPILEGMIFWNPGTELVEFVAVAGHRDGQGRLFAGEYRELADGAIERTYDVFYRSLEDIPGEALGGSRRRYREVYRFETPDSVTSTLDWFHDGAWRGFGPFATGGFTRIR